MSSPGNRICRVVMAAALALHAGLAAGQAAPHSHAGPASAPSPKAEAARPGNEAASPAKPPRLYDAPFAGYRPFDPQEPAKPWRAANEEVREAGGHIGVMKAIEAAKARQAGGKP